MRILHILDHSLPIQSGYSLRTRAMMAAQIAKGWRVQGLTSGRQGAAQEAPEPRWEEVDGLIFHRTPGRRNRVPLWEEICGLTQLVRTALRVARAEQVNILHAHSPALNGLAGLIVARLLGLPLVYEVRAFWEDAAVGNGTGVARSWRARLTRWLEDFVLQWADARVAICIGLAQDIAARSKTGRSVTIVPNGVDMSRLGHSRPKDEALAEALALPSGADVLGYIGSLYPYEGVDDLIRAMPHLVALRPACVLLVIGSGPEEMALRALAVQSAVVDHIRFLGPVPHLAVDAYYSCVDVLVYPRKKMRLTDLVTPLKPLEAMAQGRLVAASAVGGHMELIDNGRTGTLFPPDDPAAMARALCALLADKEGHAEQRAAAHGFVAAERDWARLVERYEAVYHRLCKETPIRPRCSGQNA